MRFIVYGAGGVGCTIGARLHQSGHDVVLIARGAHYEAMRDHGLIFETSEGSATLTIPVVDDPRRIELRGDDIVMLAMKSQDTLAALHVLANTAPPGIGVVCAQNGVCNERWALRFFPDVYAMTVVLPANFEQPGIVQATGGPKNGILDVGRYPDGLDDRITEVATALETSNFSSAAVSDVMRWKYSKLLTNLTNASEAACGLGGRNTDLARRVTDEGRAALLAAGIAHTSPEEDRERRNGLLGSVPVGGRERAGGSSYQSLVRGTGTIEADYLNGEIALLGRMHGVPTPTNIALQHIANRLARDRVPAASMTVEELDRAVEDEIARGAGT